MWNLTENLVEKLYSFEDIPWVEETLQRNFERKAPIIIGFTKDGMPVVTQFKHKRSKYKKYNFLTYNTCITLVPWKKKNSYTIAIGYYRRPPWYLVTGIDDVILTAMCKGSSYIFRYGKLWSLRYDKRRLERLIDKIDLIKFFMPSPRYIPV